MVTKENYEDFKKKFEDMSYYQKEKINFKK